MLSWKEQQDELRNRKKLLKERSSRQLPSDIKSNDKRVCESIPMSLEEELSSQTLDEDKNIIECDKMPWVLERELQDPTFVKKNEFSIDEESLLKEKQVEKKHPELITENVLVEVEDYHSP